MSRILNALRRMEIDRTESSQDTSTASPAPTVPYDVSADDRLERSDELPEIPVNDHTIERMESTGPAASNWATLERPTLLTTEDSLEEPLERIESCGTPDTDTPVKTATNNEDSPPEPNTWEPSGDLHNPDASTTLELIAIEPEESLDATGQLECTDTIGTEVESIPESTCSVSSVIEPKESTETSNGPETTDFANSTDFSAEKEIPGLQAKTWESNMETKPVFDSVRSFDSDVVADPMFPQITPPISQTDILNLDEFGDEFRNNFSSRPAIEPAESSPPATEYRPSKAARLWEAGLPLPEGGIDATAFLAQEDELSLQMPHVVHPEDLSGAGSIADPANSTAAMEWNVVRPENTVSADAGDAITDGNGDTSISELEQVIKNLQPVATTREPTDYEAQVAENLLKGGFGTQLREVAHQLVARLPDYRSANISLVGIGSVAHTTDTLFHLAAVLSQKSHSNVLVVETDFATKPLSKKLDLMGREGLSEVFQENTPWKNVVVRSGIEQLFVLPAGRGGFSSHPTEDHAVPTFLRELKRNYSFVLFFDGASQTDAVSQALCRGCDATFIVVQLGRHRVAEVTRASEHLQRSGRRILGCILTDAPVG